MASIAPTIPGTNWAKNYRYDAKDLYEPQNVEQIQDLVKRANRVKALGSRHCFNDIADTDGVQISTEKLSAITIDVQAMSVTIESGVRYGQLCSELDRSGSALHNLASLPHISVAGACATATHGSGVENGNLATAVSAIEFVDGAGELVLLSRKEDRDLFNSVVVNLGALGIITKLTLDIEDRFSVQQNVFERLSLGVLKETFDDIMSCGYSVSLFTLWQADHIDQIWIKRRTERTRSKINGDLFGAPAATENVHPIAGMSAENCTAQMGIAGSWYERLPHFKMGFTPSSGEELQSEYFVSREHAVDAFFALNSIREMISPHLLVSEIRTIAADALWLSPCYEQDSVAFHFTWKQNVNEVMSLLPTLEAELSPFNARPHWGKLFSTSREELHRLYPKMQDFAHVVTRYDPVGKFRNGYLDRLIFNH